MSPLYTNLDEQKQAAIIIDSKFIDQSKKTETLKLNAPL